VVDKIERKGKRQKFFIACIVILIIIGSLFANYRRYVYAVAWHYEHGNYTEIGGHRIRIPILWWKEDAHAYDTTLLVRAYPAGATDKPEVVASPAIPGEIRDTDQEELKSRRADISSRNGNSNSRTSPSLVVLNARQFTLYCKRDDFVLSGIDLYSTLYCHAVRVPYTLTYDGPPTQEKEAEAILSTLE
jgi:hypothetical protein